MNNSKKHIQITNIIKIFCFVCIIVIFIIQHFHDPKCPLLNDYSTSILYKGVKIIKSKLIDDYLSKITDDYKSDKYEERIRFNNYFNLPHYSRNPLCMSDIKSKIFEELSILKKQNITHFDIFVLSKNTNFGNTIFIFIYFFL